MFWIMTKIVLYTLVYVISVISLAFEPFIAVFLSLGWFMIVRPLITEFARK